LFARVRYHVATAPQILTVANLSARNRHPFPEVYCDLNARITKNGYSLERTGSVEDLRKLGLDLTAAVGRRFTFYMDDADEQGRPDDIMFNGVVIHDAKYGYLAQGDEDGVYWRSQISDS
jgi:hypothetical protein